MSLCFVDPADAIRAIADSIGREARRQLLGEAVRAWVDEIPDSELEVHYAKAISELDEHDLSHLDAYTTASRLVVANRETAAFTMRTRPPLPIVGETTALRQAVARTPRDDGPSGGQCRGDL